MSSIDSDDCWKVIKSFFEEHGLVSQQISSYNKFTDILIGIIQTEGKFDIRPKN
jgi:DNA-directed RNA polymerase II subunit RPB2